MSTVVLENEALVAAEIISVVSARVIVAPSKNLFLEISVPSLGDGCFRLELTDLDDSEVEEGRLVLRAKIDNNVRFVITLLGESAADGFQTNSISVRFENLVRTAESNFRGATLRAALSLGKGIITIVDKHIEDFEQVVKELGSDDGHPVAVRIRSRIGLAHYNFPEAPRLPDKAWDADLQMLIDMEGQLDAALMERYNALAAATLAGLNEDQKAEITARPEIGEAFLIDDESMENV